MSISDDTKPLLDKVVENLEKISNEGDTKMIVEDLEKLTAALDSGDYQKELTIGSAIQVNNLMESAKQYLTPEALTALSKKSTQIVEVIDLETEKVTKCLYLGATIRADNVEPAVKVISEQLNLLAAGNYIHSCLAPVSSVALAKLPGKYPTVAVIAYVQIPEEQYTLAASLCDNVIDNSEDTKSVGSLDIELPDGEFFAFERITVAANMIDTIDGNKNYLQSVIDGWLAVLPKGTELVESVACAIDSLSVPYELRFRSPVLDKVKEVRMETYRAVGMNTGKLVQGNVVLGIKYLDKEGKDVYERFNG